LGKRSLSRPKVVAVLPSRTQPKVVEEIVKALFVSDYPLSLAEKYHFGLNVEQRRLCMHERSSERFIYGSHEHLFARKVRRLRRRIHPDGREELLWTELPKYRIEDETMRFVKILGERDNSWSERPSK